MQSKLVAWQTRLRQVDARAQVLDCSEDLLNEIAVAAPCMPGDAVRLSTAAVEESTVRPALCTSK